MSSLDEPLAAGEPAELADVLPGTKWARFEEWLGHLSDRLNPILVKEARQSLRSRQFAMTFFLMLIAGWVWSILGLALLGPGAYYSAAGQSMFFVYYMILAAPLLIVIPYSAYHSLAIERQDRTYELVSITALDATGILLGKLSGIGLQMMVYLSALFPCLAFTYLLRGLNLFTVLLVVVYTCLLSLFLSQVGLFFAAVAPPQRKPIVQGVVLAALLCFVFFVDISMMSAFMRFDAVDDPEFWEVNLSFAVLYLNAFAILFLCARTQLTTVNQNRSTALRIALAVAQLSAVGWFAAAVLRWGDRHVIYGLIFLSTAAWFLVGMFIVGESPALSPRVRRDLPKSIPGRIMLSWLAPGPASGYLFVLGNMIMMAVMAVVMTTPIFEELRNFSGASSISNPPPSRRIVPSGEALEACIVAVSYIAIYLGVGKLILGAMRRYDEIKPAMRIAVLMLLLGVGAGAPWIIQLSNPATRNLGYTPLQITNAVWTMWEYCAEGSRPPGAGPVLVTMLPIIALCVWALNLPGLARELRQARAPTPPRVMEDEAELAARAAVSTEPSSPWDD